MKITSAVLPSIYHVALVTKNPNIISAEKDVDLKYINCNNKFLQFSNIKNKDEILGSTDRKCVWVEFADIYERHDKDILSGKAYGILLPTIVENNRNCWMHLYKWPKYGSSGKIIGVNSFGYEVSNPYIIDALFILGNKKQFELKKHGVKKPKDDTLTRIEKELLFYLYYDKSGRKAASILKIPYKNILVHIDNIKFKLKCNNKDQIIDYAVNNHYVSILPGLLLAKSSGVGGIKTGLHQFLSGLPPDFENKIA